jgi:CDP-diacylglycerol--serine O-phosphatidyltransferase
VDAAPYRYVHHRNALTYLSILTALASILVARISGDRFLAGALLAFCALADIFDGKFARLFPRTQDEAEFGVELDSLADALTFGLAPVAVLAFLLPAMTLAETFLWVTAAAVHVIAAVTRLGVYNRHQAETAGFVGMPTTCAGLVLASLLVLKPSVASSAIVLLATGVAMLAPLRIPRPRCTAMSLLVGWAAGLILLHTLVSVTR